MRLLVFGAAVTVLASGQNCTEGDEHCKSFVPHTDAVEKLHVRQRRSLIIPEVPKQLLSVSATVTSNLGDLKITEDFAKKFFSFTPTKLTNMMKGLSILGSIVNAFFEVDNEDTKKILDKLEQGFDKLHNKMNRQTAQLQAYIDYKFYKAFVVVPVTTVSYAMNSYKNNSNDANKIEFLRQYASNNMKNVINHILEDASDILENAMINSRYDRDDFIRMASSIVRNFREAYAVEFFRTGVQFDHGSKNFNDTEAELVTSFQKHLKIMDKKMGDAITYFETDFFPGYIKEDIVHDVLDTVGGDNCEKAGEISKRLTTRYYWRQYVAIVSNSVTNAGQYAHFGYPSRKLVVEAYNGKSVIVYMMTKNFPKNRDEYMLKNGQALIKAHADDAFNPFDMWKVAEFAPNLGQYTQMAVHQKPYQRCLSSRNMNGTDYFDHTIHHYDWGSGGYTMYPISVTVVF